MVYDVLTQQKISADSIQRNWCSGRIRAKTSTHHDGVWVPLCTTCKENKTRSVNEVESLSRKLCAVSISSQSFETRCKPFHLSERGKKGRFFGTRGDGLPYKSEGDALHLDLG